LFKGVVYKWKTQHKRSTKNREKRSIGENHHKTEEKALKNWKSIEERKQEGPRSDGGKRERGTRNDHGKTGEKSQKKNSQKD
jgi:hypothetical protein